MKSSHILAIIGCALALSACGGGGGTAAPSTPAVTLSAITSTNAPKAAANAFTASDLIGRESAWLSGAVTGVSITPANVGVVSPVLDLLKGAYGTDGGNLLAGVTRSVNCTDGGTISSDATARNSTTMSDGDQFTITANNCVAKGTTENGSFSVKVSGVSGNVLHSGVGTATFDVLFNNFSVASSGGNTVVSGDMKISLNATSSTDSLLTVSGASLLVSVQRSGATVASRALTSYSVSLSVHGTAVTTAANLSISGKTDGLGQYTYTVKNLQPFVSTATDLPTSGALVVTGADSSVIVNAIANGVRLDYSDNTSGVVTKSNSVSWSDFFSNY